MLEVNFSGYFDYFGVSSVFVVVEAKFGDFARNSCSFELRYRDRMEFGGGVVEVLAYSIKIAGIFLFDMGK